MNKPKDAAKPSDDPEKPKKYRNRTPPVGALTGSTAGSAIWLWKDVGKRYAMCRRCGYKILKGEERVAVRFGVPMRPGTYDVNGSPRRGWIRSELRYMHVECFMKYLENSEESVKITCRDCGKAIEAWVGVTTKKPVRRYRINDEPICADCIHSPRYIVCGNCWEFISIKQALRYIGPDEGRFSLERVRRESETFRGISKNDVGESVHFCLRCGRAEIK